MVTLVKLSFANALLPIWVTLLPSRALGITRSAEHTSEQPIIMTSSDTKYFQAPFSVSIFWAKASFPILITLSGIATPVNWLRLKAPPSIMVTLFGITTLINWLSAKALPPILVTLSGMVILVNWFLLKELLPILVTFLPAMELGMTSSVKHVPEQPVTSALSPSSS